MFSFVGNLKLFIMEAKELRIGNLVYYNGTHKEVGEVSSIMAHITGDQTIGLNKRVNMTFLIEELQPIPLTEKILLKCPNHKRVNGKNILNTIYFEIGRNRVISVGNIGTGNEAIWLCEIDPNVENRITDLVCIHNFDYDGKIMLHKFQNIFHLLTNEELTVNL